MKTPHDKAVREAAEALSDLNTFAIVVTILEGGHLHSPSYACAERIIKICQAEEGDGEKQGQVGPYVVHLG